MYAKLTDDSLRVMLRAVKKEEIVDKILNASSNTDDKGLTLVHYAVELFIQHCRVSSEAVLLSIWKVDKGSNKTFSRLPEVLEQNLGNVWPFNKAGNSEKPDGVYRLALQSPKGMIYRGLVVEIDGDDGKAKQPRQTATKMWEHIMYSKLTAGGGPSSIKTNGFTMRINMARAEVNLPKDSAKFNDLVRKPNGWLKNNCEFWQMQCVNVLCELLGSIVFCLRDIVMCMAQREEKGDENWLFQQYRNAYHVNMFIGPFDISVQDCTVNIKNVREFAIENCEAERGLSKKDFRNDKGFVRNAAGYEYPYGELGWTVDFMCASRSTCGNTRVTYVLVENFQGHMVTPTLSVAADPLSGMKSVANNVEHKSRMNRGLMTLIDILNTKSVFVLGGVTSTQTPNWKRKKYTGTAVVADAYKKYFDILESMCSLMENVLLYEISQGIVWKTNNTWNMRQWMEEISYTLNTTTNETAKSTRADLTMTPDPSAANPRSLVRKLKKSLCETLPQLDQDVTDYMKEEGFNNIRDAALYLRLVGVTNVLALDQLASTHSMILSDDKYHARVFHGLSVGTQSEMRMMFERIVLNPRTEKSLLDAFAFKSWDRALFELANPDTGTDSKSRKLMRDYIDIQVAMSFNSRTDASIHDWNTDEVYANSRKICNLLIENAKFFLTHGICELAQMFKFKMPAHQYNQHIREMFSPLIDDDSGMSALTDCFKELEPPKAGIDVVNGYVEAIKNYLVVTNHAFMEPGTQTLEFKRIGNEETCSYRYVSRIDNLSDIFTIPDQDDIPGNAAPFNQLVPSVPDKTPTYHETCLGHIRLRQFIFLICRNLRGVFEPDCTKQCLNYMAHDILVPGDVDSPGILSDTALKNMSKKMMFSLLTVLSERDSPFQRRTLAARAREFPDELRRVAENAWRFIQPCIETMKNAEDNPTAVDLYNLRKNEAYTIFNLYWDFKQKDLTFQEQPYEAEALVSDTEFENDSEVSD